MNWRRWRRWRIWCWIRGGHNRVELRPSPRRVTMCRQCNHIWVEDQR